MLHRGRVLSVQHGAVLLMLAVVLVYYTDKAISVFLGTEPPPRPHALSYHFEIPGNAYRRLRRLFLFSGVRTRHSSVCEHICAVEEGSRGVLGGLSAS